MTVTLEEEREFRFPSEEQLAAMPAEVRALHDKLMELWHSQRQVFEAAMEAAATEQAINALCDASFALELAFAQMRFAIINGRAYGEEPAMWLAYPELMAILRGRGSSPS